MIRGVVGILILLATSVWGESSFVWNTSSDWAEVRLSPEMRQGTEQLALKPYGPILQRYDQHSQPAIGLLQVEASSDNHDILRIKKINSVPSGFWHNPETGEIYVAMIGGGGLTILDPRAKTSVTYRNNGIWDTSKDAEGVLLRADWRFNAGSSEFGNEEPTLYQAVGRRGSRDIFASNESAFLYLIHRHDPTTYEDDELQRDFWKLGFRFEGQPDLLEDEEGLLYIGGGHGEGFSILHPDLRTVTRYHSREGVMLIRDGTIVAEYDTPKLSGYGNTRVLFKARNGDLYIGGYGDPGYTTEFFYPARLQTGGHGLTILKDFDVETQRYTTSLNYRTTGLWNTTEQVGLGLVTLNSGFSDEELTTDNLLSRTPKLPGGAVYSGWEDEEGRVYLGTSGGLAVLYPDGRLETPIQFQGRVIFYLFRSPQGDLYLNTSEGLEVWYADGAVGYLRAKQVAYPAFLGIQSNRYGETLPLWLDREGNLNASILGEGIEVYGLHREGSATSPPVDLSAWGVPQLRWEAESTAGTSVRLQIRTGTVGDESSSEWSGWRDVDDPQGAPIVAAEASHTWGQWRAIFERQDKGEAPSPSLRGVWIEESPSTAVGEVLSSVPEQTALYANYPNPFNAETVIDFIVGNGRGASAVTAAVQIYNMSGQRVRELASGAYAPGAHRAVWDGRDDAGQSVSSGVYIYTLEANGQRYARRLVLLR